MPAGKGVPVSFVRCLWMSAERMGIPGHNTQLMIHR